MCLSLNNDLWVILCDTACRVRGTACTHWVTTFDTFQLAVEHAGLNPLEFTSNKRPVREVLGRLASAPFLYWSNCNLRRTEK